MLILQLCAFFLCACGSKSAFERIYEEKLTKVSEQQSVRIVLNGEGLSAKDVVSDDQLRKVLKKLLSENQGKWRRSKMTSYAARLQFVTEGLTLNLMKDGVVLNIEVKKNEWQQYIADMPPDECARYLSQVLRPAGK